MPLESIWADKADDTSNPRAQSSSPYHNRRQQVKMEHEEHLKRSIEARKLREQVAKENEKPEAALIREMARLRLDPASTHINDDNRIADAGPAHAKAKASTSDDAAPAATILSERNLAEHNNQSTNGTSKKPTPSPESSSQLPNRSVASTATSPQAALPQSSSTFDVPKPEHGQSKPSQATAAPAKQSLDASKYATVGHIERPKKMPMIPGLFITGDESLKNRIQAPLPRTRGPGNGKDQPPPQPVSGVIPKGRDFESRNFNSKDQPPLHSDSGVLRKGRGFETKNANPKARVPPPPGPISQRHVSAPLPASGVLKGEALIREQNRIAAQKYGGKGRPTPGPNGNPQISSMVNRPAAPTNIAANDRRFDVLNKPSPVTPDHIKVHRPEGQGQTRTMSDYISTYNQGTVSKDEDQRKVVYFDRWATPDRRQGGPPQIRRVTLSNLPLICTARDVASMVWGGEIEEIKFNEGDRRAAVLFTHVKGCAKYHEDTANDIEYKNKSIHVELHGQVEPLIGKRKELINAGVTRCVRAKGVANDVLPGALNKLGKDTGALEHITISFNIPGRKDVTWRFCNIDVASSFRSALSRDDRFKAPVITSFAEDPCAKASGVHD